MTLVALSASYGAGGSVIGSALAEPLGVPFIDRAIPLAVADHLHVPYDDAAAHDEQVSTGWLERLLSGFVGGDVAAPPLSRRTPSPRTTSGAQPRRCCSRNRRSARG